MVNKIKKYIYQLVGFFGIGLILYRKRKRTNVVHFNKNEYFRFIEQNKAYDLYSDALNKITPKNELPDNDIYKELRFFSLMQLIKRALESNLEGNIAECGCFKGHSSYIISSLIQDINPRKKFFIFDSFAGLSDKHLDLDRPAPAYELSNEEIRLESGRFSCTLEEVQKNLAEFNFIKYFKGWVPERFKEVSEHEFCFVHIDVDLYQPTYDALDFFFPRLVKGGIIVIDDYGSSLYKGATRAVDDFLSKSSCSIFYEVPMGSAFLIK
ncbi:TylF/MycF family methyltransferase [Gammaproteobacteria bacterium]|nr:TylF/MycF family methyltransferase [Gammaproteobacteria bacterium]